MYIDLFMLTIETMSNRLELATC